VDFESLKRNVCDIAYFMSFQNWMPYFNMLNGQSYTKLVKDLWERSEVYGEEAARREEIQKVNENKKLKGKTRAKIGLSEFKETEIRFAIMGIRVALTECINSKAINARSQGMFMVDTSKKSD